MIRQSNDIVMADHSFSDAQAAIQPGEEIVWPLLVLVRGCARPSRGRGLDRSRPRKSSWTKNDCCGAGRPGPPAAQSLNASPELWWRSACRHDMEGKPRRR